MDLHIHSHYSRATSKDMNIGSLYGWGKIKGINVIGTGDFTHPAWMAELEEKLEPAEGGLYKLKDKYEEEENAKIPIRLRGNVMRFILTVEISNIYKRGGKTRRLHNVVVAKDFVAARRINSELNKIGNLKADGRPMLGLDSEELLKIVLEADEGNLFIPAHIWTPWYAMFGSKSGFDSIEEAFGENAKYIRAIETGLSSDPFMNWRLSQLDGVSIVSNSDAHSPAKLGREATVVEGELSCDEIVGAIKSGDERLVGTIEFFPEEGKYHLDGHRICNVCMHPSESLKVKNICPKCGRELVLGVEHRVEALADREENFVPKKHKRVEYIIPLAEMLAEMYGVKSVSSKKVQERYWEMIGKLGDEFNLLRSVDLEVMREKGFVREAEGIKRMRVGEVVREGGYDGVYGKISVFGEGVEEEKQMGLGI